MDNVYQLTETIEGYNHAKVNFKIDEVYLNCDLGLIEDGVFIPSYASAVIEKTKLVEYQEGE